MKGKDVDRQKYRVVRDLILSMPEKARREA
jgi:hypothetical protein